MRFEVLTAMAKTDSRHCHWEDSASSFFRIEKTFKPKYQAVWSHIPEDASLCVTSRCPTEEDKNLYES
jgi:hypothetical protein